MSRVAILMIGKFWYLCCNILDSMGWGWEADRFRCDPPPPPTVGRKGRGEGGAKGEIFVPQNDRPVPLIIVRYVFWVESKLFCSKLPNKK